MDGLDFPGSFPEWFKLRRKLLDLTQEELAQRAGCSVFALRKIESGERRPSKQLAGLLAQALEIPPADQKTFVRVARGELNLERLQTPSRPRASGGPPPPAPVSSPRPLPVQATPLLGREPELASLGRLFNDPQCRLLTLTGLGGIGKTRLAVEFASSQLPAFPGGVVYVPLASLGSPDLIVPAIAEVFGLVFSGPADPKEQLINYLAARTRQLLLLVLDNLEHLLVPVSQAGVTPEAVTLIVEALQRLPNVKLLVTSRERLNLRGEWMFELHGLPVPPSDLVGQLEDYGSVALFMLSARRVKPGFEIGRDERQALVRICQLLQGIPLSIELAAAWVGMLSCWEIAREIEANLDFLTTSMRDVPERHRSIRASFDHSWKLLSDEERCILCRLSVFQGGFSRHAAEGIAGASLPLLASLHSKSLVRRDDGGRYDLHEVIRQYALPYFAGDPQHDEIRDRFCKVYLALVRDRETSLKSAAQQAIIQELMGEMDNVRTAWAWAIERESFGLIGQALRSFAWWCNVAGWLHEGIDQIELFVQALRARPGEENERWLGRALAQQGLLNFRKGRFDRSLALYEESLAILRPHADPDLLVDPLVYLSVLTHLLGDIGRAQTLLDEGLACSQAAGNQWFEAYALYNQGYISSLTGRYLDGYEQMLDGLAMWRALGDPSSIAMGLNYISPTAIRLGYHEQAQAFLEESLSLCTQVGDRWGMGTAYRNLGLAALARGNATQARPLILKSLEIFGDYIVGWDIARSLTFLGDAELVLGNLPEARRIYQDALRLALEAKAVPIALDAVLGLARLHACSGEFERAFELAAFVLDNAACTHDRRDLPHRLVLEAGRQLDRRQVQAIRERTSRQSLETIDQS